MAFCMKCGKVLGPDGVCDCEKTQAGQTQEQKTVQAAPVTEGPKKKSNKIIIVVIAAVVVALAVLLFSVFGGDSHEKPLKDLTKLINKQSTDICAYVKVMNHPLGGEAFESLYKILKNSEEYMDDYEDWVDEIQDFYDDLDGFKLKYDINKAEEMSRRDLKDIQEQYEDAYDYYEDELDELEGMDKGDIEDWADEQGVTTSEAKKAIKVMTDYYAAFKEAEVTEGYVVTVRFYGELDGDEDKTDKISDIRIVKVNGTWYIHDCYELMSSLYFTDDLDDVSFYELYRICPEI